MDEHLRPEHPRDAGVPEPAPDDAHDEAIHLLTNEAFDRLRHDGFTRDEVFEWATAYLETEHAGDVDGLLRFIQERG